LNIIAHYSLGTDAEVASLSDAQLAAFVVAAVERPRPR
jgi:hypothetical protein